MSVYMLSIILKAFLVILQFTWGQDPLIFWRERWTIPDLFLFLLIVLWLHLPVNSSQSSCGLQWNSGSSLASLHSTWENRMINSYLVLYWQNRSPVAASGMPLAAQVTAFCDEGNAQTSVIQVKVRGDFRLRDRVSHACLGGCWVSDRRLSGLVSYLDNKPLCMGRLALHASHKI